MILFYLLSIALVCSAVFTVTQKAPVYSVIGLLLNFLTVAAIYFTLDAEFLGVVQIVIYSGAILMLFVFVIALLSSGIGPFTDGPNKLPRIAGPALIASLAGYIGVAAILFGKTGAPVTTAVALNVGDVGKAGVFGSIGDFAKALFTTHLLPFEATAFVLMVAIVGVVLIAGDSALDPTRGTHRPRKNVAEREPIVKAGK